MYSSKYPTMLLLLSVAGQFLFSPCQSVSAAPAPAPVVPVQSAQTKALAAAAAQSSRSFPRVNVYKWSHLNTPAYIHIAGCRHVNLNLGYCAGMKQKAIKKHLKDQCPKVCPNQKKLSRQGDLPETEEEALEFSSSYLRPVGFNSAANPNIDKLQIASCTIWKDADAVINTSKGGELCFGSGESIIFAHEANTIELEDLRLDLKPGAVLLLRHEQGITRIVNLHDARQESVAILLPGKTVWLRPGQECIAANSKQTIKSHRRQDGSLRRFSKFFFDKDSQLTVGICEVSIAGLLKFHPLLDSIYNSTDKEEHQVAEKMLKMAACLAHFTRSYSKYSAEN